MKTFKSLAFALLGAVLAGCGDGDKQDYLPEKNIEISRAQSESMNSIANFSLKIFKTAYLENKANGNGNFAIAPFNLATSLALVGNAADQKTKDELMKLFGMENEQIDALNSMFEKIISEMPELDPQSQLILANSVWTDIDPAAPQWYVDKMSESFKAPVTMVDDMKTQESANKINQWINTVTNGKLSYRVNYWSEFDELMDTKHFATLSALYFKGQWRQKFDKSATKERKFHNADGTTSKPMTMHQRFDKKVGCERICDGNLRPYGFAVRLPYGNNSFGLSLFLPDENVPFDDFVDYLSDGGWNKYINGALPERKTTVELPRFEIDSSIDYNDILKKCGLDIQHLDDIDNGVVLFDIVDHFTFTSNQQTLFRVDEEGSEVITVSHTSGSTMPNATLDYVPFDHPFIFILSERSTGAIIAAGCVNKL